MLQKNARSYSAWTRHKPPRRKRTTFVRHPCAAPSAHNLLQLAAVRSLPEPTAEKASYLWTSRRRLPCRPGLLQHRQQPHPCHHLTLKTPPVSPAKLADRLLSLPRRTGRRLQPSRKRLQRALPIKTRQMSQTGQPDTISLATTCRSRATKPARTGESENAGELCRESIFPSHHPVATRASSTSKGCPLLLGTHPETHA